MARTVSVTLIRINRQGYDSHGRYYGVGLPLYQAYEKDGTHIEWDSGIEFRAPNREAAIAHARKHFGISAPQKRSKESVITFTDVQKGRL